MTKRPHSTDPITLVAAAILLLLLFVVTVVDPAGAAFPGQNGEIAFVKGADNGSEIYVIDGDGSGQTRLTDNLVFDALPAFSPDGRRVAFTSRRDSVGTRVNDEIYVVDAAGADAALTRITNSPVNEFQPAYSPDGKLMSFTSNGDGNNEIYKMNSDGSNQIRLTFNTSIDSRSSFSPDGEKIAFSRRDGPTGADPSTRADDIYVMNPDGSDQTRLTTEPAADTHATFSPDGNKIAFASVRDGNSEIYVMNPDGSDQTRLTFNGAIDEFPAFSPDGTKLAFSSNRGGNFEIYVMNSDGSGTPERLTNDPAPDSKPDWGPLPDTTPPEIALNTPPDGTTYLLGQRVNAEYACRDEAGGSGLLSCAGPVPNGDPLDTSTVGNRTFTVEAADQAGNRASVSHGYGVVYDFGGLFGPVDNPPVLNTVKAGRAVPVKFSLGGKQGLDVFAEGYPRSGSLVLDPDAPQNAVEQTDAAGESSLSYDPATNEYTYVWKTEKAWSGEVRQLVLKLDDGSEHAANFDFD